MFSKRNLMVIVGCLCFGLTFAAEPVVDIDFVKLMAGSPEGISIRTNAELMVYGLRTKDWFNKKVGAGCTIGKHATPEAFELKATFMVSHDAPVDEKGNAIKGSSMLWDDKFVQEGREGFHKGMQLNFSIVGNKWTPILAVGVGKGSYSVTGPSRTVSPGEVVNICVRYYGDKRVDWNFGGKKLQSLMPASGTVVAGNYPVTIGDRVGLINMPFWGAVQRVTLTPLERQPYAVSLKGRTAFERGEKGAFVTMEVENISGKDAKDLKLKIAFGGVDGARVGDFVTKSIEELKDGESKELMVPVETCVKPGWQKIGVEVTDADGGKARCPVRYGVGPRYADRMTTLMWQGDQKKVFVMGLTHVMVRFGLSVPIAEGGDPASGISRLDEALVDGVRIADGSNVIFFPRGEKPEKYYRRHRDGTQGPGDRPPCEIDNPELLARAREVHTDNALSFKDHPAFCGILNCSEWREWSFPSFNQDHLRYKAETGREVPGDAIGRILGSKRAKERYPDGIVPDDDEVLAFYRWFWSGGDGWADYFAACAEPYRKLVKRPFFSWWDPAVRCPPRYGSGKGVDRLNQWVYAYPEAMNVAGPCEDLLTMCEEGGQEPMIMTQLICYRSQVAPEDEKVVPAPEWVVKRPHAKFPSIPPDTLRQATWAMISKPVKAIAYHGWGCISETGEDAYYTYTNSETEKMMKFIQHEIVQPLGPMLKKLGREKSPVAVLESFTSVVNGSPWNSGYAQPPVTFLQRARLDPRVVYEETIEKYGFDGIKVLYVPAAPYLTPSMIGKLKEFRRKGGILIGDTMLVKAVEQDITIPVVLQERAPAADHVADVEKYEREKRVLMSDGPRAFTVKQKENSQKLAEDLRKQLASKHFRAKADSSSPELFTFSRKWEDVDYLFVINDKRTFGDYFGPWGRMMEKGLPFSGWASIQDPKRSVKAVYELYKGGEIKFKRDGENVVVPLEYDTNDGRILAFLPDRIARLDVRSSEEVAPGGIVKAGYRIIGENGQRISALLPGEIHLYDADGVELDGAGYVAAEDGIAQLAIRTNLNDAPGDYRLVCKDRASGLVVEKTIKRK